MVGLNQPELSLNSAAVGYLDDRWAADFVPSGMRCNASHERLVPTVLAAARGTGIGGRVSIGSDDEDGGGAGGRGRLGNVLDHCGAGWFTFGTLCGGLFGRTGATGGLGGRAGFRSGFGGKIEGGTGSNVWRWVGGGGGGEGGRVG